MAEYSGSRIVWLDPNMSDNKMVNLEDLSIKVEFTAEKKGRSIIYSGTETKNTAGTNTMVNFIEGSRVDASEQKSLTTRYTEAIALEVMNKQEQTDDFESLGIESIDIEFNSAYTPVVKIKFIDVRGNAILSHGNLSKYRMFFELPYPIFKLSVKGFYGKTVNYCLHMLRWNASFNSETGNFEIQADFIGYTYALLTDLLLGLVRAAVRTGKGQQKLADKQREYGDNSHLIITIDDLILRFATLSENLRKIDSEDNTANQLQTYEDIYDGIAQLRTRVNSLSTTIYDGTTPNNYFRSTDGQILAVPTTERDRINSEIEIYNNDIKTTASSVNGKIGNDAFKFKDGKLTDIVIIKDLLKKELTEGDPVQTIINKSGAKYNGETGKEWAKQLLADLGTLGNSSLDGETKMDVYNLKRPFDEINNKEKLIKENETESTDEFGKKLISEAESVIGFKPSIRNIFRVLTVNSEIFLEVLRDVSVSAETSTVRAAEFKKISGNINVNETTVNGGTIYPWPEYRKQKKGEPGFEETYLGTETIINPQNIDEVVFTEEMLKRLMEVAKFDKDLDTLAAGTDIDKNPFEVEYPWYPVTTIDTPLTPNMSENPYGEPVNSGKADEVIRLVLLRGFLLLGVGAFNNKFPTNGSNGNKGGISLTNLHGRLEAENFIATCRRFGRNGQGLAGLVVPDDNKTVDDYVKDAILKNGIVGSKDIDNAPLKRGVEKPILTCVTGNTETSGTLKLNNSNWGNRLDGEYRYIYHFKVDVNGETKLNLPYIPVNKDFAGKFFYSGGKFKEPQEMLETKTDQVYVSVKKNTNISKFSIIVDENIGAVKPENRKTGTFYNINNQVFKYNDGSDSFRIIEYNDYTTSSMKPSFGTDIATQISQTYAVNQKLRAVTVDDAILKTKTKNDYLQCLELLDTVSGNYSWLEFDSVNLDDGTINNGDYVGELKVKALANSQNYSSLVTYYAEFDNDEGNGYPVHGTYLSYNLTNDERTKPNVAPIFTDDNKFHFLGGLGLNDLLLTANGQNGLRTLKARELWLSKGYQKQQQLINDKLTKNSNLYLPFIEFGSVYNNDTNECNMNISLFGSTLYNQQNVQTKYRGVVGAKAAKAILFLHTIAWKGVKTFSDNNLDLRQFLAFDKYNNWDKNKKSDESKIHTLKALFEVNSAFVHAPKAWVLFIGAMLYRLRYSKKTENGITDNLDDTIIYYADVYNNKSANTLITIDYDRKPRADEYLYISKSMSYNGDNVNPWGMCFGNDIAGVGPTVQGGDGNNGSTGQNRNCYTPLDKTLVFLPIDIQEEFINYFVKWVNDDSVGFGYIQKELEIWRGYDKDNKTPISGNDRLIDEYKELTRNIYANTLESNYGEQYKTIDIEELKNPGISKVPPIPDNVIENYALIAGGEKIEISTLFADVFYQPVKPQDIYQVSLVLKQDTPVMNNIIGLLTEPVILQNGSPIQWNFELNDVGGNKYKSITVKTKQYEDYLNGFYTRAKQLYADYKKEDIPDEDDEIQQEIFGTTNDTEIKLMIYRTLSSINDKWLNGSKTQNVFVQCGTNSVNRKDLAVAKKYRAEATEPTLIDTFRFVDRSLADIGDKFFINIDGVVDLIRYNYNQSLFDVVNKILVDNNFNFIPLPSFVNFNNMDELKTVFSAYTYNDKTAFEGTGPSFVCVYVGQTSVNLDLGVDSVYPDDGLSLSIDSTGNVPLDDQTADFNTQYVESNGDLMVPVFAVNYGQQNQNFFRSVKLDQREFAETMESLQVIESLSQGGDKSSPSYAGNNLFNVYKTRSYSAEVEMLGNPMIQPMMYFQLNNIPMFRGAYLIYKVNHSIKPNSMTTTFKGNRVKKAKTPLMEESAMYLNIVNSGTGGGGEAITSRSQQEGYYAPIVRTLIDNGVTNAYIDYGKSYGQITTKKLEATDTDYFTITSPGKNRYLITEAIEPLRKMLNDWGAWMKSNGFKTNGDDGKYIAITSMYRDFATQQGLSGQKTAAAAGTSYHGWALAVDMKCVKKNGEYVSINVKDGSSPDDFKFTGENATNPALKWLYDNSYKYGFLNPLKLRDNNSYDEYWHWEYHGTSAKCIVSKNPTVYGQKIDVSGAVNSFVKNPKNPDGTEAVYTDCTYQYVKTGDGIEGGGETVLGSSADFWSLVAISSLEAGIGQARADVAQSIYNRLATPGKRYGKSIKEIIVSPGQYEPTKNSISKWQAIKDEKTAIEAIKASKGWDDSKAKKAINDTISALNNSDYQLKSRQFIETRTEFLGYYPTSKYAKNVVHRKTPSDNSANGGNNYFYWEYAGKELIGKTPPNPPNLSQYS